MDAISFVKKILVKEPYRRMNLDAMLEHQWFSEHNQEYYAEKSLLLPELPANTRNQRTLTTPQATDESMTCADTEFKAPWIDGMTEAVSFFAKDWIEHNNFETVIERKDRKSDQIKNEEAENKHKKEYYEGDEIFGAAWYDHIADLTIEGMTNGKVPFNKSDELAQVGKKFFKREKIASDDVKIIVTLSQLSNVLEAEEVDNSNNFKKPTNKNKNILGIEAEQQQVPQFVQDIMDQRIAEANQDLRKNKRKGQKDQDFFKFNKSSVIDFQAVSKKNKRVSVTSPKIKAAQASIPIRRKLTKTTKK